MEGEEPAAEGLSQEEESRSDSEAQELSRGPPSPPPAEGEDRSSDLRDEASSVTRELDEHELDYDEEVPEEPAPAAQEDDEERGEGAPGEEGKAGVHAEEPEPPEAAREKKKEDDDGEIDDGEIDDDDLEEGEVKDPSDRKVRPRPTCRFFMKGNCPPEGLRAATCGLSLSSRDAVRSGLVAGPCRGPGSLCTAVLGPGGDRLWWWWWQRCLVWVTFVSPSEGASLLTAHWGSGPAAWRRPASLR